jgi:hypothetical protein
MTDFKIIDIRRGGQTKSWLRIYPSGRIEYHVENDGYRFMRRGPEASDEWIDLDHLKNHWPHLFGEVEAALMDLEAL